MGYAASLMIMLYGYLLKINEFGNPEDTIAVVFIVSGFVGIGLSIAYSVFAKVRGI